MTEETTPSRKNVGTTCGLAQGKELKHLSKSILLEETGSSLVLRSVIITVSALVFLFIVWASFTRIEEVAVTSGKIIPFGQVQKIQHPEGGVIREVPVREGDPVKAGQVLVVLDDANLRSKLEQEKARQASFKLQKERILFILDGHPDNSTNATSGYVNLAQGHRRILEHQLSSGRVKKKIFENQISQDSAELAQLREKEKALRKDMETQEKKVEMLKKLMDMDLISKYSYLEHYRQFQLAEGELAQLAGKRSGIYAKRRQSEARLLESEFSNKEKPVNELAQVENDLFQVGEIIERLEKGLEDLKVKSPVEGYVHVIKNQTVRGVVTPADVIMEIVPKGRKLVAEVQIASKDIGYIAVGQQALIKFATYDFGRFGGIRGKVEHVSPTSVQDEKGQIFFKAFITPEKEYLGNNAGELRIIPGMTVTADIRTGEKTVIAYLLKPIQASARQAFRER